MKKVITIILGSLILTSCSGSIYNCNNINYKPVKKAKGINKCYKF